MRESSLEALLLLATLFVIHDKHAKALVLLEGLYDVAPSDERILRLLAHSLLSEKQYDRALDVVRELMSVSGSALSGEDTACALRLKASALWNLGRIEEARAALEQSITYISTPAKDAGKEPIAKQNLFW